MTEIATANGNAPKLLIADDDPAIVNLVADRCARMGFTVETAANGLQLLIKARRFRPDIMIVDVNMPELDGLSVCLRFLDPGSEPVDVIVITGSSDPETAERCESLGLFYGRKGPEFWSTIETALVEVFPELAGKMDALKLPASVAVEIHQRPRILLIDDDPDIQRFFASRLDKLGIDTLYATDAVQGYRMAAKARPSAIITDYFMPDGDAKHLLVRLRGSHATENIPVIVISGRALDKPIHQDLMRQINGRPGAAHIFKKSFDTGELFRALQNFCSFGRQPARS